MSKQQKENQKCLYKDQTVQITEKSVKVLKFYFPQDSKNQILFKDINKLSLKDMDEMDQSLGVDPQYFKDFNKRVDENKNMYIEMAIQDQSVRLCFAPQQPVKVLKLIEQKWQDAKIQKQGQYKQALKQNKNLYANVEMTAQKMQTAEGKMKKSELKEQESKTKEGKRSIESPSRRLQQGEEERSPKKKVKESQVVEADLLGKQNKIQK